MCSRGEHLPANWTIIYHLSRLPGDATLRAIADKEISPELERKNAIALVQRVVGKGKGGRLDKGKGNQQPKSQESEFSIAWDAAFATEDGRKEIATKLNEADRDKLVALLPPALLSDVTDRTVGLDIARASKSGNLLVVLTKILRSGLKDEREAVAANQLSQDKTPRKRSRGARVCQTKQEETEKMRFRSMTLRKADTA